MMTFRAALILALTLITTGTFGGEVMLPADYDHRNAGAPAETPYWKRFNDPVLNGLVARAMRGNFDVDAARHRIAQAEAAARQSLAPLLPSVSAEASWSLRPFDTVGTGVRVPQTSPQAGELPDTIHSVSTLLKASYLVDITGRAYRTRQAALKEAAASRADAETLASNLVTLIAQAYYDVVAANLRRAMVEEQIANNEGLLKLVEARFRTGASNALDVLQQRQQLEATRAQLPLVRALATTTEQQLAALTGAGSAADLPEIKGELPPLGEEPGIGKPDRLLTARPDLRAAAKRLDALADREKSALRTLLPSLALNGQVGYQVTYADEWDNGETWSLGAALTVPLYQGGAAWAGLDASRAASRAAESSLRQRALDALRQVESALVSEREQRERLGILEKQMAAAKRTFEEARKRYLVGLSEYLNVLAALGTLQNIELGVLQAKRDVLTARIQLLGALGGDWTRRILSASGDE